MPVWVLLQGQNVTRKILPKSKRCTYIGYNDETTSILYYNAETKRCLTSRNYEFLTALPPEPLEAPVIPDVPTREGELEGEIVTQLERKRKNKDEHETNQNQKRNREDAPMKTRGV